MREYNAGAVDQALADFLQNPNLLRPQLCALIESGGSRSAQRQLLEEALRASGMSTAASTAP